MTTSKLSLYFLLVINLFACNTTEQQLNAKEFAVETRTLRADTVITSAVYIDGHILYLQADHKIFVLDTLLKRVDSLTAKFSNLKVDFLHTYNDTIFIGTDSELYFLNKEFTLTSYNHYPFKYGLPYYNDDTYYVYACSAGEWGGAVFFWNKKSNKTYSYPAPQVQQVFKFRDMYVISNYLAHLSGFSDYFFIKDPTKLYELKDEKQKTFCNWHTLVDSIKDTKLSDTITSPGIKYYTDTFITRTITTFPYKNGIYSIYCTDNATILAKFQDLKLVPVDTLFYRELNFHNAKTNLTTNKSVTAYEATWAVGGEGNSWTPYQNTGLIFINNNKITFLEFQTPHMRNR